MHSGEIIGIILVLLVFETFTHFLLADTVETIFYTPRSIYEECNINWFGTIIVYLLIFPFSFILGIGGFLKWLFTIGRKV